MLPTGFHLSKDTLVPPLLLAGVLGACAPRAAHPPRSSSPATACSVDVVGREHVSVGQGTDLYVEPRVVGSVDGGYLLAGQPTYTWTIDPAGHATMASRGDFFGVIVRNGRVRRIPLPPDVGSVGWIIGAPVRDDRWVFVFEELDRPSVVDGEVQRILHGELEADGWRAVEELRAPPGGRIDLSSASSVEAVDGRLEWAALFFRERGGIDVLGYRYEDGAWSFAALAEDWADAVDLLVTEQARWLAVGGLDPDFGAQIASLRLIERAGSDRAVLHRLVSGADGVGVRFRSPVFARSGTELQLGWVRTDDLGDMSAWVTTDLTPVDSTGPDGRFGTLVARRAALLSPVISGRRPILWATLQSDPESAALRIRLHRVEREVSTVVLDLESPFHGRFATYALPSGEVFLVGPEAHSHPTSPFVRSLVLRLNLVCDQVAAADHPPGP